jgi:hypothetical protein
MVAALAHRRHPIRAEQPDGGQVKRRWPIGAVISAAPGQRCCAGRDAVAGLA